MVFRMSIPVPAVQDLNDFANCPDSHLNVFMLSVENKTFYLYFQMKVHVKVYNTAKIFKQC